MGVICPLCRAGGGWLPASLNDRLNDISAVLAGCERIAYTPIPFAYTLILHRTVYLFCIMLPFALVVDLHYMTPFISVLISYTFISLDCLAEELEVIWRRFLPQSA